MLDGQYLNEKPKSNLIMDQSLRVRKHKETLTLEELVQSKVRGQAHCPSVSDGGMTDSNWLSQIEFELDSDGGTSVHDFLERVERYNIKPFFVYKTFSYTQEKEKFRACFVLEEKVIDTRLRQLIQHSLLKLFLDEIDSHDYSYCPIYQGTNKGAITIDYNAVVNIDNLIMAVCHKIAHEDKNNNCARAIKTYAQEIGVNLVNGMPNVNDFILSEDEYGFGKPNKRVQAANVKSSEFTTIRDVDFNDFNKCAEYKRWVAGDLIGGCNNRRVGLMSNLIRCKGGEKRVLSVATEMYPAYLDEIKNAIKYHKAHNLKQWGCEKLECEDIDTCNLCGYNVLTRVGVRTGKCTRIEYPHLIPIVNASNDLLEIREQHKVGMAVIKAPTAIGKTTIYLLEANKALIVEPTHKMGEQVWIDRGSKDKIIRKMPSLEEDFMTRYELLIRSGAYGYGARMLDDRRFLIVIKNSMIYLMKSKGKESSIKLEESEELFIKWYAEKFEALESDDTVICTHEMLMYIKEVRQKEIIIDEDITQTIITNGSISEKWIEKFLSRLPKRSKGVSDKDTPNTTFAREYLTRVYQDIREGKPIRKPNNKEQRGIESSISRHADGNNIMALINCNCYIRKGDTYHYVTKRELPKCSKITILSATVTERFYKALLGEDITFYDLGLVEQKGKIIQHSSIGYSRNYIKEHIEKEGLEGFISKLVDMVGNKPVITFKSLDNDKVKALGLNVVGHFGGVLGLNEWKGQDIVVIGTPHVNEIVYKLTADVLNLEYDKADCMSNIDVEHNGYKFKFMTFTDLTLRAIQFYMIESEILQAVGRARTLREDCTATLYSNYPIREATN